MAGAVTYSYFWDFPVKTDLKPKRIHFTSQVYYSVDVVPDGTTQSAIDNFPISCSVLGSTILIKPWINSYVEIDWHKYTSNQILRNDDVQVDTAAAGGNGFIQKAFTASPSADSTVYYFI